ncbi:MAG: non-canonical purine NTP pyrophosphatase, partial [Terriglobia bacterium]
MLPGIRDIPSCAEDGGTFEINARKKAVYYSRTVEGLVFADDSGLCVDALGGAPGVYSARYAGENATDEANNKKLRDDLDRLRILGLNLGGGAITMGVAGGGIMKHSAHYVCAIALAEKGSVLAAFEGRADGVIQEYPKGEGGFGYDPFFCAPQFSRTFAELKAADKFVVSHRGIAFRKMVDFLKKTNRLA